MKYYEKEGFEIGESSFQREFDARQIKQQTSKQQLCPGYV